MMKKLKATRGGRRTGAGRPAGSGKFGEATVPVRIPESMVGRVMEFVNTGGMKIPLYSHRIAAGFPSPADDYTEGGLDLNEYLIRRPAATFFIRVVGESMINAGIFPGSILVVDRSLEAVDGKIVIAEVDGELTVKRLLKEAGRVALMPENPKFKPIEIQGESQLKIWGVVTSVVHKV